jgi:hypothetical protein
MSSSNTACTIEHRLQQRVLEFAAYRWPEPGEVKPGWPSAAGALARDVDDGASLLHFAPGRVLAPDPSASTEALLDERASQGLGTRIDVTGKWEQFSVRGPGAARLLACAFSLDAVLGQRDCAAVTIFDCPAIVAKCREGFDLWVLASYAGDFLATAENFRAVLQRPAQAQ